MKILRTFNKCWLYILHTSKLYGNHISSFKTVDRKAIFPLNTLYKIIPCTHGIVGTDPQQLKCQCLWYIRRFKKKSEPLTSLHKMRTELPPFLWNKKNLNKATMDLMSLTLPGTTDNQRDKYSVSQSICIFHTFPIMQNILNMPSYCCIIHQK